MNASVPVTVVGGYLGAGKTTLVNHLLRNANGLRIAILVNDFGDLPIDADLIEAQADDLISIAGGCVCCSFGSDLMGALMKMAERSPAPDHVLIETSGVALPGSVARSVALIPGLSIDGVTVLVDAETVRSRAADRYMGDTIMRQLAEADLVVVNKVDLAGPAGVQSLLEWISQGAPRAKVVESLRGAVPAEILLGSARRTGSSKGGPSTGGLATAGRFGSSLGNAHHAASVYASASFEVSAAIDVDDLAKQLVNPACGVLRAKGVLRDLDSTLKTLHVVGARMEVAAYSGTATTGLACIGLRTRLDPAGIERVISAAATDNTGLCGKSPLSS